MRRKLRQENGVARKAHSGELPEIKEQSAFPLRLYSVLLRPAYLQLVPFRAPLS